MLNWGKKLVFMTYKNWKLSTEYQETTVLKLCQRRLGTLVESYTEVSMLTS